MNFDLDNIQQALFNLIGFDQSNDGCTPKLHPDLLVSSSLGRLNVSFVEGADQFLTNKVLFELVNNFQTSTRKQPDDYVGTTTYAVGNKVTYTDGLVYVSRQDSNTGNTPTFDGDFWETELSSFIRKIVLGSARQFASDITAQGQYYRNMNQLIDSTPVFSEYRKNRTLTLGANGRRFRGYKLQLKNINNLSIQINKIGLNFATAQTIRFYLYHTSQTDALQTVDVTIDPLEAGKYVFKQLDAPVKINSIAIDNNHNAGGAWFFGYYEGVDTLEASGDVEAMVWTEGICSPILYKWGFSLVRPSQFNQLNGIQSPTFGDYYEVNQITETTTFNLQINQLFDYDYPFRQLPSLFAQAFQYYVAKRLLNNIKNSSFVSANKETFSDQIDRVLLGLYNENGDRISDGLADTYNVHKQNLIKNIDQIDTTAYENKQKVRYAY